MDYLIIVIFLDTAGFTDFLFQVFGDEAMDVKIEDVQLQDLGQIGEISVTKDDTLILKVGIQSS